MRSYTAVVDQYGIFYLSLIPYDQNIYMLHRECGSNQVSISSHVLLFILFKSL